MGYVSASRSIGSVDAARVRTVLEQSLSVSAKVEDSEVSTFIRKPVRRVMQMGQLSSSEPGRVVASRRRSLHDVVTYRGAASPKDLPPASLPDLVETTSIGSVSSTSSINSVSKCPASLSASRSIFGRYWEVKKEQKITLRPTSARSLNPSGDDAHESVDQASRTPPDFMSSERQGASPSLAPATPPSSLEDSPTQRRRRSIFASTPSPSTLDLVSQLSQRGRMPLRKASSTSVLLKNRRSCLHSVQRYSSSVGGASPADSTPPAKCLCVRRVRSASVSFSPEIDVVEFHKAYEVHAEEGWSDFFH